MRSGMIGQDGRVSVNAKESAVRHQAQPSEFGASLRDWRGRRRLSQLDLALEADISARHISFLETGRSQPSRAMVLRLCERLELPLQARNQLLVAAGLAPQYDARPADRTDMRPAHAAIDWMLKRHHPYPALTLDRHWRLVSLNGAARTLFAMVELGEGDSMLDALCDNGPVAQSIENLDQLRRYLAARLNTEIAHFGPDPVLQRGRDRMLALLSDSASAADQQPAPPSPVIPAIYSAGGMRLSLFSTISHFGTAEDVALSELRIELLFPADEETRQALMALA